MKIGSSPNVSWIISSVGSDQLSRSVVSDSATPWTAARQASLSITSSQSLLKLVSIESVMSSNRTLIIQHSQIFNKWIHKWIKMAPVWKGDHKCLAWDSFPSLILDEPGLLQSCRLVWGHPLSGGFIQKVLGAFWTLSLGQHCPIYLNRLPPFKTQKGHLGVCFLKNSPEILIQNSYLSLLLLSKFFMGKKEKDFDSISLDTPSHQQW